MSDPVVQVTDNGRTQSVVIQTPPAGAEAPKVPDKEPERPAWLPPKFKTAEDLAKSYTELEKKLGAPKTPEVKPAGEKAPESIQIQAKAEEAVKAAGLDMKALEAEMLGKGDLSAESKAKLAAAGIGEDQIAVYKKGFEAIKSDFETAVTKNVEGGRGKLDEALKWAAEHYSAEEQAAFNKIMDLGDKHAGSYAVDGLMSRFAKSQGPQLVDGSPPGSDPGDVFRSQAQVTEAIRDPRYANDPAYRKQVEAKMGRSDYSKFNR